MMAVTSQSPAPWHLEPVSSSEWLWLPVLDVLLPMGLVVGSLAFTVNDPAPKRLIGGSESFTTLVVFGGTLLLCLAIHWVLSRAMRRPDIHLAGDGPPTTFEDRRGGKECGSTWRHRGSTSH